MTSQSVAYDKILTIINPVAGKGNHGNLQSEILKRLPANAEKEFFETTGNDDLNKLTTAINAFQPDLVFVAGGDGTVKLAGSALGEKRTRLAIVPRGSANGLATDLNLPTQMDEAVKVGLGQGFKKIDAININGQMSLHISDLGINAELIKHFESGTVRGKPGYLLQTIPTLIDSEIPYQFKVTVEGNTIEHEAIMVAFANSKKFGTGTMVNPKGAMDDGIFEVLVFKQFDIPKIVKTLYGKIEMETDFVSCYSCTQATVTSEKPVAFQIDGEFMGKQAEVVAKIEKGCLSVAVA